MKIMNFDAIFAILTSMFFFNASLTNAERGGLHADSLIRQSRLHARNKPDLNRKIIEIQQFGENCDFDTKNRFERSIFQFSSIIFVPTAR